MQPDPNMAPEHKPDLECLFRDNPATKEGKYLVLRRDGTVFEHPSFVLGARDENATEALRFYALLTALPPIVRRILLISIHRFIEDIFEGGVVQHEDYVRSVLANADKWDKYREAHGDGDPLKGPHRKDDSATIARMREGNSA